MEKIFKNDEWVAEIWLIKRDFAIIARDKSNKDLGQEQNGLQ